MKLVTKKSECKKSNADAAIALAIIIAPMDGMNCGINYCQVAGPMQISMIYFNEQLCNMLSFTEGFSNN